jgi:cytochrome c553
MNNRLALIVSIAALLLAPFVSTAESLVDGSAEAGKAKAVICAACHGQEGVSVNPMWPNLAGQSATYIVAQLQAFKRGDRVDPLMSSQAMLLSDEDMRNVAVYYESLPQAVSPIANPASVAKAEAIYRGGIPAAGDPALNGQHADYAAKQLRDYGSGARKSDGTTRVMRSIASRLSEDEIVAIASYVQGLK